MLTEDRGKETEWKLRFRPGKDRQTGLSTPVLSEAKTRSGAKRLPRRERSEPLKNQAPPSGGAQRM